MSSDVVGGGPDWDRQERLGVHLPPYLHLAFFRAAVAALEPENNASLLLPPWMKPFTVATACTFKSSVALSSASCSSSRRHHAQTRGDAASSPSPHGHGTAAEVASNADKSVPEASRPEQPDRMERNDGMNLRV